MVAMQALSALERVRRRIARPLLHGLRRGMILRRIARVSDARFLGHRLRTEPGVFHPTYFSSSKILAEHLLGRAVRGVRALDMGTGAGPIAVALAAAGAVVTACDVNPRAVALARANAKDNGLAVEVIESDLFAALEGRTFDLIDFNIPFYATEPTTHFERAFRAGKNLETVRRFADGCRLHLAEGGRVVIVFSEDCDRCAIVAAFADATFSLEDERTTRSLLEDFHVVAFRL
jgi:release factor glutamine methyltransferase